MAEESAVREFLTGLPHAPDVVINTAGFTHVDRCERDPDAAARGNERGPAVLARCCRELSLRLVHVSTDYVFPGDGGRPYTEEDDVGPRSTYGRTKLAGERAVLASSDACLVVRTSWVFGRGRNFLAAILDQAAQRRDGRAEGPLRVVADQTGRPTGATDLARGILQLVEADARGLYHLANDGVATWWDLARFCLDEVGCGEIGIEPIETASLDLPAPRPEWSVLDCTKARDLGVEMRDWREAVRAYLRSDDAPALPSGKAP